MKIGIISDTHGLLRPEVLAALEGCEAILHAGDIGGDAILAGLRRIAPVHAVRGNCDGSWARALPWTEHRELGGLGFYLIHDLAELDLDPSAAGVSVVVSGHSHQPKIAWQGGVLYLNPGSAGPRRFTLPIALARLELGPGGLEPEIVTLG
ncbi:MAG: metallophosphoesterase family protein [Deltaproteobacteria bacterium]|nr:metallophosphoesterase family protein [Deltaproteobacteria bacterium]